eukprot:scaffold6.g2570.t1
MPRGLGAGPCSTSSQARHAAARVAPGAAAAAGRRWPRRAAPTAAAATPAGAAPAPAPAQPNVAVAAYLSVRDQFRKLDGLWDSRARLFNLTVSFFLFFYGGFALLYPHHDALHFGGLAEGVAAGLPAGLAGAVGMVRNWMFTLFYAVSELWGDVVLSLLFWGLANETTSIEDAPLLYPLFGIGANVAQALAGRVLRVFSDTASASHLSYAVQLQVGGGKGGGGNPKGPSAKRAAAVARRAAEARAAEAAAAAAAASSSGSSSGGGGLASGRRHHHLNHQHITLDLTEAVKGLNYCDLSSHDTSASSTSSSGGGALGSAGGGGPSGLAAAAAGSSSSNGAGPGPGSKAAAAATAAAGAGGNSKAGGGGGGKRQAKAGGGGGGGMSLRDAFDFLKRSPQIRCLAVMALAQGITTNLLDIAWKHYLHRLATTPAAYSAFLGDTAMGGAGGWEVEGGRMQWAGGGGEGGFKGEPRAAQAARAEAGRRTQHGFPTHPPPPTPRRSHVHRASVLASLDEGSELEDVASVALVATGALSVGDEEGSGESSSLVPALG